MPHSRHDAPVAHVDLAEVRLAFARMPRQVQETGLPLRRGLAPEPRHGPGHRRQRHPGPVLVAQPLMDAGRGMRGCLIVCVWDHLMERKRSW